MIDTMKSRAFKLGLSRRWSWVSPLICVAAMIATHASAADIPVTTINDSGAGSERQGLATANSGDRLAFSAALDGLTLQNTGPLSVTTPVTLLDSTGITLTDNHAYSLAAPLTVNWTGTMNMGGVLSDGASAGSLIKDGSGKLVVSGVNTYTGGTYLYGGTLSIQDSSSIGTGLLTIHGLFGSTTLELGNNVQLNNNVSLLGDTVFKINSGSTARIDGVISDTGGPFGISTSGDGTLILSGANTFGGGIYVADNLTLRAENNSAFGTGTVTVAGGLTIDLANGVNVNNHIRLGNNLAVNVDSGSATLSGVIGEAVMSRLDKNGAGTLILSGANTYTGATRINAGELQVNNQITSDVTVMNSTAALSGIGSVGNVVNNGIVRPGNSGLGDLTVNGNFTQNAGGTTEIRVSSSGQTDHLTVTGQANLDGTLKVFETGGGYGTSTHYTILNATSGVNGQFSSVVSNLSMFTVTPTYNANDVQIELVRSAYLVDSATTTNQINVATALDNIALTSTGSLFNMINTLGGETPTEQQQSLNQLSGAIYGSTQTIGLQVGDVFQQRLVTRMVSNGMFLAGAGQPGQANGNEQVRGQSPAAGGRGWIQGFGQSGRAGSDGNAPSTRYSQGGAVYGADWGDDENGIFGVAASNSYVGFHDSVAAGGQATSGQFGIYGLKHNELVYALGSMNYGLEQFDANRNVLVGNNNQTLRGSFLGHQFGAYAETGMKYHMGLVHLQPLFALQYLYLAQQGFSESGGSAALNVSANQADSLRTNLGGRIVVDSLTDPWGGVWTPYWHGRWVEELLGNDRIANASFNGAPVGGTFVTHGSQIGNSYFVYGKGVQVQVTPRWSLYANVDLMVGGRVRSETGTLGGLYCW